MTETRITPQRAPYDPKRTRLKAITRQYSEPYGMGGRKKTGVFAPKKVSLARLNLPPADPKDDKR